MGEFLDVGDNIKLYFIEDRVDNPNGVILINHGFAEHTGRYEYISKFFNDNNFTVYRYDLRGHGRTKSRKGHIESYKDFIDDCNAMVEMIELRNPKKEIMMLGHSMGGLVTAMYGIEYPNNLKGQIFSGPAVNTLPPVKSSIRSNFLNFVSRVMPGMRIRNVVENDICSDKEVVEKYKKDPLVLKEATAKFYREFLLEAPEFIRENISKYNYPCFIAHGEKDIIVPVEVSKYLYENISSKDKTRKIYDGLYHEILNEKEKDIILNDILDWIENRI